MLRHSEKTAGMELLHNPFILSHKCIKMKPVITIKMSNANLTLFVEVDSIYLWEAHQWLAEGRDQELQSVLKCSYDTLHIVLKYRLITQILTLSCFPDHVDLKAIPSTLSKGLKTSLALIKTATIKTVRQQDMMEIKKASQT